MFCSDKARITAYQADSEVLINIIVEGKESREDVRTEDILFL
jgi:hypothetical protein